LSRSEGLRCARPWLLALLAWLGGRWRSNVRIRLGFGRFSDGQAIDAFAVGSDVSVKPSFLRTTTAKKPRTAKNLFALGAHAGAEKFEVSKTEGGIEAGLDSRCLRHRGLLEHKCSETGQLHALVPPRLREHWGVFRVADV
jgi:hypothetical protein